MDDWIKWKKDRGMNRGKRNWRWRLKWKDRWWKYRRVYGEKRKNVNGKNKWEWNKERKGRSKGY